MTILNKYKADLSELAQATVDFLQARLFIKLLFLIFNFCCALLLVGFALKAIGGYVNLSDFIFVLLAIGGLFGKQALNKFMCKTILAKLNEREYCFMVDNYRITWEGINKVEARLSLKDLKYIYKNNQGYIIPITGFKGAGKFLWLPCRGFESSAEEQFLLVLAKQKIRLKSI